MTQLGLGAPLRRMEDRRLLTGAGCYVADLSPEGVAFATVVRAPFANATLRALDTDAARRAPGVLAVFTAADLTAAGVLDIPCLVPLKQKDGAPLVRHDRPPLARDAIRHAGDPVALVVAETLAQAQDAAELVVIDYDPHSACVKTAGATAADAPQVWSDAPRNTAFVWEDGDREAVDTAFAHATRTVALTIVNNRIIANPMEPRAIIGDWREGRYTLHAPTQGVHGMRRILAKILPHTTEEQIRVVTPDVGGGFGTRIFCHPEHVLALFAARHLERPVKWVAERATDAFVSDTQGRDHVSAATLALDADGRFLALRVATTANLGAYLSSLSPFVATLAGCRMLSGAYRIAAIHVEVTGVYTHSTPVDAYRGAGRPEAIYLLERLVDQAARETGIDAAALRRLNFIRPTDFPYQTPLGPIYDSGLFKHTLDAALTRANRDGFAARKAAAAQRGRWRGFGFAYYIESCGLGQGETTTLHIEDDGRVILSTGSQSNGQGHETAYRQLVASRLGIAPEQVTVIQGDTDLITSGAGTGASRFLTEGGMSAATAAQDLIETGLSLAATALEAAVADMEFQEGRFRIVGSDRGLTLAETARAARRQPPSDSGAVPALRGRGSFRASAATYPNGCHVCEVEVDPETGVVAIVRYTVVDDFGVVLNPLLLAGQVHGGIGQGIGQALLEHTTYDLDSGQLLSGSLMDYALLRADGLPALDIHWHGEAPCRTHPMGVKGAGEAGAIGAPPAVINALHDALGNSAAIAMPATPERVWRAIRAAQDRPTAKEVS